MQVILRRFAEDLLSNKRKLQNISLSLDEIGTIMGMYCNYDDGFSSFDNRSTSDRARDSPVASGIYWAWHLIYSDRPHLCITIGHVSGTSDDVFTV